MKLGNAMKRRPGGFTLIELITVVAILAILVTLGVGAYGGIRNHMAATATLEMFAALDTGLQQYYADFNGYPWMAAATAPTTGMCPAAGSAVGKGDFRTVPSNLLPPPGATGVYTIDQSAAVLYNALNARMGHGPGLPGGAAETMIKKNLNLVTGATNCLYTVYVDGWGRQIYYWPADVGSAPNSDAMCPRPRLAGDGSALYFKPAPTYQCALGHTTATFGGGTCVAVVNSATCGRPLLCPKGPVLESLGSLESDDSDNMLNWGTLSNVP
jgi:prepilin-type N-terminal cleavage/methylation domain-containing protein